MSGPALTSLLITNTNFCFCIATCFTVLIFIKIPLFNVLEKRLHALQFDLIDCRSIQANFMQERFKKASTILSTSSFETVTD